ncbi:hypothetical protein CAPTEDRAFT_103696 [Capitella teleta]|uniref:Small integral membrane protein 12 n=1 Tax=Capitella teleta TaxID=283909 RepID=R7URD4_CAPTE|nr:hypothetical protein CAPTEDRAFT_101864 [Capitella teleta]ELU09069.1 hypothetical protein CAPTEDRAFT_103696 [Capitella teleta]|eukprot:ELT89227.1 hypothetical protein CAPTEDRAFT_101864 [Capitella teleta]
MWPVFWAAMRSYSPYIVWPFAAVVGFIGYNAESMIRGEQRESWRPKGIAEERDERLLKESENVDLTLVDKLKDKKFVPKTIFDRNQ